jgi:hypothetical protein
VFHSLSDILEETHGMHQPSCTRDPFLPTGPEHLTVAPGALRVRLGVLISRYLREGSAELARSVVAHLEALCQDPELRDADQFCAYRRLARHWRWLSEQHGDSKRDSPLSRGSRLGAQA